ncbi:MAG TPA: hypothetical protein GXX46_10585 [Peptococcaceae bacterium]|nr:hypothetical protein [Peptococcaceae bacterium]
MRSKKVTVFLIVSLVFQLAIFLVLEHFTEQFLNPLFRLNKAYTLNVDLSTAQNITLSFNNRYLAYIAEGTLHVIDLTKNDLVITSKEKPEAHSILAYKWLPDRNSLLYIARTNSTQDSPIGLYSLDFDPLSSNSEQLEPRLERSINFPISNITDIQMSTYTNNLFVLYKDESSKSKLLTIDIMKNINRLDDPAELILAMAVSNKFGTLFLESQKGREKKIFAVQGRQKKIITANPKEILLGCQDEFIYIGKVENNYLQEIYLYTQNPSTIEFTKVLWQGSVLFTEPKVFISKDQKIFFMEKERMLIVFPNGSEKSKIIKSWPVLSPAGKMYLEIFTDDKEYYWRKV